MVEHGSKKTDSNTELPDFLGSDIVPGAQIVFSARTESADAVFLVGTFNNWGESHPLQKVGPCVWQITLSGGEVSDGDAYKFKVYREGGAFYFADPYALENEGAPHFNSVYREVPDEVSDTYKTEEHVGFLNLPLNVFSIRADLWQGGARQYSDMARELVPYMMQMGYTHLCMSGVFEEYYEFSSGRTLIANFAPRKEQGGIEALHELVHLLHACGIGVLLDRGVTEVAEGAVIDEHFLVDDARYWLDMYGFDGLVSSASTESSAQVLSRVYGSLKREYKNAYFIDRRQCGFAIGGADAVLEGHGHFLSEFIAADNEPLDCRMKMAVMSYVLVSEGRGFTSEGCEFGKACESSTEQIEENSRFQLFISDLNALYLENSCLWSCQGEKSVQRLGDAITVSCCDDGHELFFAADTSGRGCEISISQAEGKYCVLDSCSERYGGTHRVPYKISSDKLTLEPYEAIIIIGD